MERRPRLVPRPIDRVEVGEVFTVRNLGGIALFLFGTTFVWLTPEFATSGVPTDGPWWAATRILALVAVIGFTVATWGLFQRASWWEAVAIGSAALGYLVVLPYLVAAVRAGEATPWFTASITVLGSTGVLVLLLVPSLERWVSSHVATG
jgi:hypothetical protein